MASWNNPAELLDKTDLVLISRQEGARGCSKVFAFCFKGFSVCVAIFWCALGFWGLIGACNFQSRDSGGLLLLQDPTPKYDPHLFRV